MKKTTLLFAGFVSLLLAGCYSTNEPEQVRLQARRDYQAINGCQSQAAYQHKYFKECAAKTAAAQARNHKTVQLMEDAEGRSIVVPRASDDAQMLNPHMVYPVVDVTVNEVVIKEESATEEDMTPVKEEAVVQEETVAQEETVVEPEGTEEKTSTEEVTQTEESVENNENTSAENVKTESTEKETTTQTTVSNETSEKTQETIKTTTDTLTNVSVEEQEVEPTEKEETTSLEEQVNALLGNENSPEAQKEVLPTEEK